MVEAISLESLVVVHVALIFEFVVFVAVGAVVTVNINTKVCHDNDVK